MIKVLSVFLIVLCYKCVSGQQQGTSSQDSSLTAVEISNLTVMLYQPVTNKSGTGTVIKHKSKFYLLTANHIAESLNVAAKIIFRLGKDKPWIIDLERLTNGKKLHWLNHDIADVSMTELIPFNKEIREQLTKASFPSSWIDTNTTPDVFDVEFLYLGFPVVDLDMKHFSPLMFFSNGTSGLITQSRLDKKDIKCDFFYLEKPSMEGCSGSGVFVSVVANRPFVGHNRTYLKGIVHGTQGDKTGGKLAMVTPAFYIYDLLKKL